MLDMERNTVTKNCAPKYILPYEYELHVTGLVFFITIMTQPKEACKKVFFSLMITQGKKNKTELGRGSQYQS